MMIVRTMTCERFWGELTMMSIKAEGPNRALHFGEKPGSENYRSNFGEPKFAGKSD